jgi:hypothetical protein
MTHAAADKIPDDIVVEILFRVSTDSADLFRCAATCKRWCALIADKSFLGRRWPEKVCHRFSLLGFFVQQRRSKHEDAELGVDRAGIYSQQPPFFVPAVKPPKKTPLGARRRFLTSFVTGVPAGLLDGATPLTARCGLLLVRLACGSHTDSIHLALCDPLAGTCDVLPPLECPVTSISCAILTGSDYCSSDGQQQQRRSTPGYSTFFTVLTVVDNYTYGYCQDCNLYMFSSAKPSWSTPTRCFDTTRLYDKGGFTIPLWNRSGVVCQGMARWLCMKSSKFYTFNVGIEAGNISLTELSIPPADQLNTIHYGCPTLGVAIDGTLNLFHLRRNAADLLQLDIWTPRGDNVGEIETFWLRVGTFNLNAALTRDGLIRVWSGEKSGTLFIFYASCHGACIGLTSKQERWRR